MYIHDLVYCAFTDSFFPFFYDLFLFMCTHSVTAKAKEIGYVQNLCCFHFILGGYLGGLSWFFLAEWMLRLIGLSAMDIV